MATGDFAARKRPSSNADAGPSHSKKRAIASPNGFPKAASPALIETSRDSSERDAPEENLEVITIHPSRRNNPLVAKRYIRLYLVVSLNIKQNFRKEAIYRRMRQYRREKERADTHVVELEKQRSELQGSIGAIENCWSQVNTHLWQMSSTSLSNCGLADFID